MGIQQVPENLVPKIGLESYEDAFTESAGPFQQLEEMENEIKITIGHDA